MITEMYVREVVELVTKFLTKNVARNGMLIADCSEMATFYMTGELLNWNGSMQDWCICRYRLSDETANRITKELESEFKFIRSEIEDKNVDWLEIDFTKRKVVALHS